MSIYGEVGSTRKRNAKQTEQATPEQKLNAAGGYTFSVSPDDRFRRFLILGTEGGTYYAGERDHTLQTVSFVRAYIETAGERAVQTIRNVSKNRLAPKVSPCLFALAVACNSRSDTVKRAAFDAIPEVANTGAHLLEFAKYVQGQRGWGSGLRKAVAKWYTSKDIDALSYQLLKYQQRNGISHRQVLKMAHPKPAGEAMDALFNWAIDGTARSTVPQKVLAHKELHSLDPDNPASLDRAVELVVANRLTHEMIPTQYKRSPKMWEALLNDMPLTAMLRNLGNMTACGLIAPDSLAAKLVRSRLDDVEYIRRSKIHPYSVLIAMYQYSQGRGFRGKKEWSPVARVTTGLDRAFYTSFGNVKATGKRLMIALDVSSSMGALVQGGPLTAYAAECAFALATLNVEPDAVVYGFTASAKQARGVGLWEAKDGFVPLDISADRRIDDCIRYVGSLAFGGTDCSLPMRYATTQKLEYDAFVIWTDNETWAGPKHVHTALENYRQKSGINAKLVVCAMTATDCTIANPNDRGMLDVVGMDASVPNLIADFVSGVV